MTDNTPGAANDDGVAQTSPLQELRALDDALARFIATMRSKLVKKTAEGWRGWNHAGFREDMHRALQAHAMRGSTHDLGPLLAVDVNPEAVERVRRDVFFLDYRQWPDVANFALFLFTLGVTEQENRVVAILSAVYTEHEAREFLRQPQKILGGEIPRDLILRGELPQLDDFLRGILAGKYR